MYRYNRIQPRDIVVLRDEVSKHIGIMKISKTTEKIKYLASTSLDYCSPNIELIYETEEETGKHGNIIYVSEISPFGKALIGSYVHQTVEVKFPSGRVREYRILEITPQI